MYRILRDKRPGAFEKNDRCSTIFFVAGTRPISHRVGRSVGLSVGPSHFALFAFLSRLKVEKFRYEYFMRVNFPAQIITALAQLITAPAQPATTELVVNTALFWK